jgi:hypothetical protein
MKRILTTLVLCLAVGLTALAQQNAADAPATKEDVQKYLDAVHSHEMMLQVIEAMSKPMHTMIHEQYMKDKDKLPPDFEARMNKMTEDLLKGFPWDEIMQATVPVYQKHFTKGDIDALTAFYASPTGEKVLREMPGVMADSMDLMMPIITEHMRKVQVRVEQQVAEMLKESQTPPVKRPPTLKD